MRPYYLTVKMSFGLGLIKKIWIEKENILMHKAQRTPSLRFINYDCFDPIESFRLSQIVLII